MVPGLASRGPGRVIVLNGASHSGKSTLAKEMQQALAEPVPARVVDHLVAGGMLPVRRDPDGPFAWWDQMRPGFSPGSTGACLRWLRRETA